MGKIRRKIYLIKTRFQLKYTGLILLFMLIIAVLSGYTVYQTAWRLMGEKLSNVYPQGRLVVIMRTINLTLLYRIALLAPVVAVISILLSHRIAGPLYRIERFLRSVARGDFSERLRLRKRDELKDLAESINVMVDDLKNKVKVLRRQVNMARLELNKMRYVIQKEGIDVSKITENIEELNKNIEKIESQLSQYRLESIED